MTEPTDLQGWRDKLRRLEDELSEAMDGFVATDDPDEREAIVQVEDRLAGQIAEAQSAIEALEQGHDTG